MLLGPKIGVGPNIIEFLH